MARTREDYNKKYKDDTATFKLDVTNAFGIDAMRSRMRLKNYALTSPASYVEERAKIYTDILTVMVTYNYNLIWALLEKGQYPDKDGKLQDLMINGAIYSPELPSSEVSALANSWAESIMEAFDKIISKILPDDYKDMAENKMAELGKLTAQLRTK